MIDWVGVLGGLGVFLYSLRFLNRLLVSHLNGNLRSRLRSNVFHRWQSALIGVLVTVLVQASSITVLASMGLVGASLIGIEQAFLIVLGAGLGTTLKAWMVGMDLLRYAPALIGLGSLGLVVTRDRRLRMGLELVSAVGFAGWGLNWLSIGMKPVAQSELFQGLMDRFSQGGLSDCLVGATTGFLMAALLQSSSAVVALVIVLAGADALNVLQGATLILGANVGTTVAPLLASLEYGIEVRRLALANSVSKILGVSITILLFPQFMAAIGLVMQLAGQAHSIHYTLAAVHSLFNLMELICWGLLPWPILAFASGVIRSAATSEGPALPLSVRKLFSHNPERCAEEADNQLRQLGLMAKNLMDSNFRALCQGRWLSSRNETQQSTCEAVHEAVVDLLIRALRADPNPELQQRLDRQLRRLVLTDKILAEALHLRDLLKEGLGAGVHFSPAQLEAHKQFAEAWRALWLAYLTDTQPDSRLLEEQMPESLAAASASFVQESEHQIENASWMFSVFSNIRGLAYLVREMIHEKNAVSTIQLRARPGDSAVPVE